jgi:pimeloyl-ACP methyl ester carboxylesterase
MSKQIKDAENMTTGSYAHINDLNLYYEIHGTGQPLILIHGGLGGIAMFAQILPALTAQRQVIGVELQAHGHTADIDRPLSFASMADDVAALIQHLGHDQVDLIGYSLGGGVAWQTAIRHPAAIRKLVVVSAPCQRQGWYPEVLTGMAALNAEAASGLIGSPPHQAYASAAPKPQDWSMLVEKTGHLLRQDYDWSADVAALKIPTQLIFGDADSIRPEHFVELFQLLGGGQRDAGWDGSGMSNARLAVLPATTHYNIIGSPLIAPIVTAFLDAP